MTTVSCSTCGIPRRPELAQRTDRPACPQCGGTSLTIGDSVDESGSATNHLETELIPGNQARDWKQRWKLVVDELRSIQLPHTETQSGESIHAALQRLLNFFISTYHLKDALKDAASGPGLSSSDVEDAVTTDARLALLADLANLDKHLTLSRPPRSGTVPAIERISGVDEPGGGGWQLSVQIRHGASMLDGLAVAHDAIKAWREKLNAWRLI